MRSFLPCFLLACLVWLPLCSHAAAELEGGPFEETVELFPDAQASVVPGDALPSVKTIVAFMLLVLFHSSMVHYLVYLLILFFLTALQINPVLPENLVAFNSSLVLVLVLNPIANIARVAWIIILSLLYGYRHHPWLSLPIVVAFSCFAYLSRDSIREFFRKFLAALDDYMPFILARFDLLNEYLFYICAAYVGGVLLGRFFAHLARTRLFA